MSVLDQTSHYVFRLTKAKVLSAKLVGGLKDDMLADRTFSQVRKMLKCYHLAYENYTSRVRAQTIPKQVLLAKERKRMLYSR